MRLLMADGMRINEPSIEQVERAVRQLDGRSKPALRLEAGPLFFVRCDGDAASADGLLLRVYEGDMWKGTIWQAENVPVDVVVDALCRYALADPTWNDRIVWVTMPWKQDLGKPAEQRLGEEPPQEPIVSVEYGRHIVINRRFVLRVAGLGLLGAGFAMLLLDGTNRTYLGLIGWGVALNIWAEMS